MNPEHTRAERDARLFPQVPHLFDLRSTVETLRSEPLYATNGRNGITLVKNPEMRLVLQAMSAGSRLAEHHAPGPITVQVLEGEIEFSVGETVHTLHAGSLLALPARVPHSVHSAQESVFLLTLVPQAEPEA